MKRRMALAVVVGLWSFTPLACGQPQSELAREQQIERVMRAFMRATAARDADQACDMLNGVGRRDMAAYPYPGGTRNTGRSCEQTVERLDQLPHAAEWPSLSRGTMVVSVGAGLDNSNVRVEYDDGGRTVEADGSVQPNLGGGYDVTSPPTPPKTFRAPRPGQP